MESLDDLKLPLPARKETLLVNVLIPDADVIGKYDRKDVLLNDGRIEQIGAPKTISVVGDDAEEIDCSERMLMPGFVNGHSHSVEHWARGLISQLPLELWLFQLYKHEPRGTEGWFGQDSFEKTPSSAIGLSALHAGLEALLSGCTAVMDHLFVRNIDDIEAAIHVYKFLGIRAFLAPMLGDDKDLYTNYLPLAPDAKERNEAGCNCGIGEDGKCRTQRGDRDPSRTAANLALYEEAIKRFHDPDNGIEIVVSPVAVHSASMELLKGATELRKKYDLCGHIHLLETRSQALMARQFFPSKSAVKHLKEAGYLDLRGTSCAHTVWLTDEELSMMAESGAVCVHNPLSNLRLGSGVMPVKKALDLGVTVAMGCDGACSSDGQDLIEALKTATIVSGITTPEYREWLTPHLVAMSLATKNGYIGLGMSGKAGEIKVGYQADLTLWDLTALSMLPRTDPVSLLVLGSRTQAADAGSTLDTVWVRGRKIVSKGSPLGVDIKALRAAIMKAQPEYRSPSMTNPKMDTFNTHAEFEYRAAVGLDPEGQLKATPPEMGSFEQGRVLYDSTIP